MGFCIHEHCTGENAEISVGVPALNKLFGENFESLVRILSKLNPV